MIGPPGPPPTFHLPAGGNGGHFHGQGHRGGHGHGYKRCERTESFPDLGTAGLVADPSFVSRPTNDAPDATLPATILPVAPIATPAYQPPVVNRAPIPDIPSPRRSSATRKTYARSDTNVLMPISPISFAADHNASDLVQFTSALRDAVSSQGVACGDTHLSTDCWEKCLERHVLRAVRSNSPQASSFKSMIGEAFAQRGRLQDAGQHGPTVVQHIIRSLCRGLSRATPAAVMQTLQNLVVSMGTPFSTYLSALRLLVENVRCVVMLRRKTAHYK